MKYSDTVKPFEFILKKNGNIICQRYFNIRNYNNDCRESLELKDMMNDIVGMKDSFVLGLIPEHFKQKCMRDSWIAERTNSYYARNNNNISDIYSREDKFTFTVNMRKELMAEASFDANLFQPSVRRHIDIKEIIPNIIEGINYYLSLDTYTSKYSGIKLERLNKNVGSR